MVPRLALVILLATALRGCAHYEYEHEFWLNVDGSGTVSVTGRPALWTAFKSLPLDEADPAGMKEAARELFEGAGLEVRRLDVVRRRGQVYLHVRARFEDVNRLSYTRAFPDLRLGLRREAGRLRLDGSWQRPLEALPVPGTARDGLLAVRFHLPSKVYAHRNAEEGVERGNILTWSSHTAVGLDGGRVEVGAEMDDRSILFSTVMLFALAVVAAVLLLSAALWAVARHGRKELARSGETRGV